MNIFIKIAEERIIRSMEAGEFENLKGAGKPLSLEDEAWVPEDLRMTYRVLKNAGCIPAELDKRKEILSLKDMINVIDDDKERLKKLRELNFRLLEFNMMRKIPFSLDGLPGYGERILEKLAGL